MNERDMLLILTLCELLVPDKNVEPREVERAFDRAKEKMQVHRTPTPQADIYRAGGR